MFLLQMNATQANRTEDHFGRVQSIRAIIHKDLPWDGNEEVDFKIDYNEQARSYNQRV